MCNIRFIALTLVWTVNFTLSLSLNASEISTISDVSVFKSTDWVRVWNRKANSQINQTKLSSLHPHKDTEWRSKVPIKRLTFSSSNMSALSVASWKEYQTNVNVIFRELIKNSTIFSCSVSNHLTIMVGTLSSACWTSSSRDLTGWQRPLSLP